MKLFVFLTSYIAIFVIATSADDTNVLNNEVSEVMTDSGPVEGTTVTGFSGKEVTAFYGIPYAQPPVNELRFRPPEPVKPWTGVLKATHRPVACYQQYTHQYLKQMRSHNMIIPRPWSEDCLTLNIWVPKPVPKDAPVLIFFHSGGFVSGSGIYPHMDGSTLSAETKTIVVSMNYRLGVFGFLNFGTEDAPGNMGLLDQQLAMKWIHENIHQFGGKAAAIILVGTGGAGSASVGYHVISKGSAGLFKTATYFSGSPTCSWAFQNKEISSKKAEDISTKLGCSGTDIKNKVECLRRIHPEDILDSERSEFHHSQHQFIPSVDGTFITEPPIDSLIAGRFNNVVQLVVTNQLEGSLLLRALNRDVMPDPEKGLSIEGFRKAVQLLLPGYGKSAISAVEEFYVDSCSQVDPLALRDAAIKAYSDASMECCVNELVEHIVRNNGTAFRVVDDLRRSLAPAWIGSSHAISTLFIFGYPLEGSKYGFTSGDGNISLLFMDWIDRHTRMSNLEMKKDVPMFNLKDRPYIHWDEVGPQPKFNRRGRECILWDKIIPMLKKK